MDQFHSKELDLWIEQTRDSPISHCSSYPSRKGHQNRKGIRSEGLKAGLDPVEVDAVEDSKVFLVEAEAEQREAGKMVGAVLMG